VAYHAQIPSRSVNVSCLHLPMTTQVSLRVLVALHHTRIADRMSRVGLRMYVVQHRTLGHLPTTVHSSLRARRSMTYAHEERDGNPPGVVPSTVKHEASRSASGWNPASSPYHTADRSLLREESSPVQNSPRHKPVQNISRGYRHASIGHDAISSPQRSVRVYQPLGDYADETTLASSTTAASSREETKDEEYWYSTDP
jgi:hypothetical protein